MVRYSAGILDWRDYELRAMDVKMRKRLYMKRKHGGRGLISVYDCVWITQGESRVEVKVC